MDNGKVVRGDNVNLWNFRNEGVSLLENKFNFNI